MENKQRTLFAIVLGEQTLLKGVICAVAIQPFIIATYF